MIYDQYIITPNPRHKIMTQHEAEQGISNRTGWLKAMVLTAMAAGMGWGIRGQYGHESGAMIAGCLTSLTLVLLFAPGISALSAARAAAMMTVAIGIGGSMTYGQTVGLTHDRELAGNLEAFRWGMIGLFIKGGIWISFSATFLGMGLGGKRYKPLEILVLMVALVGLMLLGIQLINRPFDIANKILPKVYFSDSWYFEPNNATLKPRPEIWGGMLTALLALTFYVRVIRRDKLAGRMAIIGYIAGGLGFSGGQCVQAFHAWHPEVFTEGALSMFRDYFAFFNWWNMMETSFGLIFGSILGLGLWANRHLISSDTATPEVTIKPEWEVMLVVVHTILLVCAEFVKLPSSLWLISRYIEFGLVMAIIPMIGIVGGRLWPYLMVLPITAIPICGKSLRQMLAEQFFTLPGTGWLFLVMIPVGITLCVAAWLISNSDRNQRASRFGAVALLVTTWLYFGLNTQFFHAAWPWEQWTGRTPNQIINMICTIGLTSLAISHLRKTEPELETVQSV